MSADYARYRCIRATREGRILVLALDRPPMNAVDAELHGELASIFYDVGNDRDTDVVVLTGTGRAFSAGGDTAWFRQMAKDPRALDVVQREGRLIIHTLLDVEQPVIAAVNGPATGLGATLALFADTIFMADTARIGDPHVKMGIVAGDGGAIIWPWLVGPARAGEAERIGLVNHVVAAGDCVGRAMEFARRLAAGPTLAIRWTKLSVNKLLKASVNLVLDASLALEVQTLRTEDHQEAVRAFDEKRAARFQGR
jgi:enoyl-CoA hydratase